MSWRARLLRWALLSLGVAAALVALIVAAASLLLAGLRGVAVPMPEALWFWLPTWWRWAGDPRIDLDLRTAIAAPSAFVAVVAGVIVAAMLKGRGKLRPARPGEQPPAPIRAASDAHGHADWMSLAEARAIFPGPHPGYGGVVIGEAYRVDHDRTLPHKRDGSGPVAFDPADPATWGRGGKVRLLVDPCTSDATHGAVFAGSGGYKTTAVTIPTLAVWTGSAVVLDPSCQVGPMTAAMRRGMGHAVAMVGPGLDGFNVLDWIDPADPLAETHVQAVIERVAGETPSGPQAGENAIFKVRGKELLTCLLADLLWDSELTPERRTLREFRKRVLTPEKEMPRRLREIHASSDSELARDLASTLMRVEAEETFSGIYSNANADTQWLSIRAYADMLSGGAFRTGELAGGKLTVFVQVPMEALRATPEIARVVIGSLLGAAYRAEGRVRGRILFLLDEVNFLGRLKVLEDARDAGRKYGITLVPMWQSLGQLVGTWGKEAKASWFNSCSWTLFAAVNDQATAEEVSKLAGRYTILTRTEGQSSSTQSGLSSGSRNQGRNEGLNEQGRDLITPDEVRTRLRKDEAVVFRSGALPLRCGRAVYFRRPDLRARIEADRYRAAAE